MGYTDSFPYSTKTQKMLDYLPGWMAIRMERDGDNNPTVAAQFLNPYGLQFEDIDEIIKEGIDSFFISESNEDIPYMLYVFDLTEILNSEHLYKVNYFIKLAGKEEYELIESETLKDFYDAERTSIIIDNDQQFGYLNKVDEEAIEYIRVDSYNLRGLIEHKVITDIHTHHVWNSFDEIGLLLGLPRLRDEDNTSYKRRLLKVFSINRGATKEGVQESLANMLNINDWDISINEFANPAFKGSLLDDNGRPTEKMLTYASKVNKQLNNSWDTMGWDEAYWKSIDEAYLGLDYLPHIWNVQPRYCPVCHRYYSLSDVYCTYCSTESETVLLKGWDKDDYQSGVGDTLDLMIKPPDTSNSKLEFDYYIKAHGVLNKDEKYYPEHTFSYKVYAQGVSLDKLQPRRESLDYTILASERHDLTDKIKIEASQPYTVEQDVVFDQSSISKDGSSNNQLEIVSSNKIVSPSVIGTTKQNYLKVVAELTGDAQGLTTPSLEDITVTWIDGNSVEQSLTLSTSVELEGGDLESGSYPRTSVEKTNTVIEDDAVKLAKKGYYKKIDTENEWRQGTLQNCKIINGTLTL